MTYFQFCFRNHLIHLINFSRQSRRHWRVPKVELHRMDSESHSATWIGLDGGTWGLLDTPPVVKVLQAGTYHDVYLNSAGKPVATYFAFFGLDEGNPTETNLYSRFQRSICRKAH